MELLTDHLTKGLFLILMLSIPITLTAALIGLVIGIIQAVTQVQEQTISAAPKILSVFLLIIFGGGLMLNLLTQYLRESTLIAFQEVPLSGTRILPPQTRDERQQRMQQFFTKQAGSKGKTLKQIPSIPKQATNDNGSSPQSDFGPISKPKPKKSISEQLHLNQR